MLGLATGAVGGSLWKITAGVAGGILLAAAVYIGWQAWTISGLEADVAEARQATAECRTRKAEMAANRDELKRALQAQTNQVERLARDKRALANAADARASEVRAQSAERERTIPDDVRPRPVNEAVGERLMEYGQ